MSKELSIAFIIILLLALTPLVIHGAKLETEAIARNKRKRKNEEVK